MLALRVSVYDEGMIQSGYLSAPVHAETVTMREPSSHVSALILGPRVPARLPRPAPLWTHAAGSDTGPVRAILTISAEQAHLTPH